MEFRIHKEDFLNAINISQAISSRTTMEVIEGILIEAFDNNSIRLTSTDFEISIVTEENAEVIESGAAVIKGSLLGNIIRKLPSDTIEFKADDKKVDIKCQNSFFSLSAFSKEDYPSLVEVKKENGVVFEKDFFLEAVKKSLVSVADNDSKPQFMGVLLDGDVNKLNFIALDGYRISSSKIKKVLDRKVYSIIPSKALIELSRILESSDDLSFNLYFDNNHILFDLEFTRFYTRLIDGKFIDYERILESNFKSSFTCDKKSLIDALERISLITTSQNTRLIKININEKELNITSNNEIGKGSEIVEIKEFKGEGINIAFNYRYLLDGLRVLSKDEVKVLFSGSNDPCLIVEDLEKIDFSYLVLPVRIKSEDF